MVIVFLAVIAGYLYFSKSTKKDAVQNGAVGTVEEVSKQVPHIVTNPAENVPEVNPLDRANPFKYTNPLR